MTAHTRRRMLQSVCSVFTTMATRAADRGGIIQPAPEAAVGRDLSPDGIYASSDSGTLVLVHEFIEDDYGLEDIHVLFALGSLESVSQDEVQLDLTGSEVRILKTMADAQSFDHGEGFISMCLDVHAFAAGRGDGPFRFHAGARPAD